VSRRSNSIGARAPELAMQRRDARVEVLVPLPRRFVLEVLPQVAVRSRLLDRLAVGRDLDLHQALELFALGGDGVGRGVERTGSAGFVERRKAETQGGGQRVTLVTLERCGLAQQLERGGGLRLVEMGQQARRRAPRLEEWPQTDAVGGELLAAERREQLLQEAERRPCAQGFVVRGALGEPDKESRRAARLCQDVVERAVETLAIALREPVGEQRQHTGILLAQQQVAKDRRPVVPPLANHGEGTFAQEAIGDAGQQRPGIGAGRDQALGELRQGVREQAGALEREEDLPGERRIGRLGLGGRRGQGAGELAAEIEIAVAVAAENLDALAGVGAVEAAAHRVESAGSGGLPAVALASRAQRHDLGMSPRGGPPRAPLRLVDDAGEGVADLSGGERMLGGLEHGAQELRRLLVAQLDQPFRILQLAAQEVSRLEDAQHLRRGAKADRHAPPLLEIDLQRLEREVDLDHPPDALTLHGHDRADVVEQDAAEPGDPIPELGGILHHLAQSDPLERGGEIRLVGPQPLERGDDLPVQLGGFVEEGADAAQRLETQRPVPALAELAVPQLQQAARPIRLAGGDELLADGEKPVDGGRVTIDLGDPVVVERRFGGGLSVFFQRGTSHDRGHDTGAPAMMFERSALARGA
jgi:hypothetical protein